MSEPTRPHMAVVYIHVEVHAIDDKGQCSGLIVDTPTLKKNGIKPVYTFAITGKDREECLINTKERLDRINEQ